jgi:hypothetical protein
VVKTTGLGSVSVDSVSSNQVEFQQCNPEVWVVAIDSVGYLCQHPAVQCLMLTGYGLL